MNDIYGTPTINEIIYNQDTRLRHDSPFTHRFMLYHIGDVVLFRFGNLQRKGRITTCNAHNGITTYHIETENHTWYREIDEQDIISVQSKQGRRVYEN